LFVDLNEKRNHTCQPGGSIPDAIYIFFDCNGQTLYEKQQQAYVQMVKSSQLTTP